MSNGNEIFGSVYDKGAVIFKQGDLGHSMYIIQSGAVEVSQKREDGQEVVLALLGKDDFFGEMALLQDDIRSATIKAICQTRLLPLTKESFLDRIKNDPGVALHLMKGLIFRIQNTNKQIREVVESDDDLIHEITSAEIKTSDTSVMTQEKSDATEEDFLAEDLSKIWKIELTKKRFKQGEQIFSEGDDGDTMYIILSGSVEIFQGSESDKRLISVLSAGEFFGEMAIITNSPRMASAGALEETELMTIGQDEFVNRILEKPELAPFIILTLTKRLKQKQTILSNPESSMALMQKMWQPLLKKKRIKISIISLSTCAGCSSVLLDDQILSKIFNHAEIVYCPMLMDRSELGESDVILVDGVVRLREEVEKLQEARQKSRYLVAWGTCAVSGGIPTMANDYELEDLIEETYGQAGDTFSYYLSGKGGVDSLKTYQEQGIALMRHAFRIDNFARVDYYLPGCPPNAQLLLQFISELMGEETEKAKPIVCAECPRRVAKNTLETITALPPADTDPKTCFTSYGIPCMGFLSNGGCGAPCTSNGLVCWGCRGPSKNTYKKIDEGESFEEVVSKSLSQRCKLDESKVRLAIKQFRKQGHVLYNFENMNRNISRHR